MHWKGLIIKIYQQTTFNLEKLKVMKRTYLYKNSIEVQSKPSMPEQRKCELHQSNRQVKIHALMKLVIFMFVLVFLVKTVPAQQPDVSDLLNAALQKCVAQCDESKTFIKTDKDIYVPGEKIWFKAEIINCITQKATSESELIVMLKAETGEIVIDNKYLIENGMVSNQLSVPTWTPEGKFFLIAYTPNSLKNNKATLAAIKPISVNMLKRNDYTLVATLDQKIYKPSDEIRLSLQLKPITPSGKKEKVTVSLYDYHEEISTLKQSITVDLPNELKFKLPEKVNDGFYLDIQSAGKSNFSQKVPVFTTKDPINVEFFPEGGTLLTNNIQRIVYRATDALGEPVDVSGTVYDQMNNQSGAGKTLKKGFGLISLMPMPTQHYFFKIESDYGKGQKFEIPQAKIDGSSLTLVKIENETLRLSVVNSGKVIGEEITIAAIAGNEIKLKYKTSALQKHNFDIPTNNFDPGIINFVVFGSKGEVLSERLIYNIPNKDVDTEIVTNLTPSEKNGDVEIDIDLKKFIDFFGNGPVDVRIVDKQNIEQAIEPQQFNFLKYPLLTPTPKTVLDIYITNIELIANQNKFITLTEIMNGSRNQEPNSEQSITGIVLNKKGKPVGNVPVMAIANNQPSGTVYTDAKGHFVFPKISKPDNLTVKALDSRSNKNFTVKINKSFDETLDRLLLFESFKWETNQNTGDLTNYYDQNKELLKLIGTENKDYKPKETSTTEKMLMSGSSILDVIKMLKPFTLKDNQIVFYGTANSIMNQQGALIVIDGQKMGTSISAFELVNPSDVASINVSTNPVDIQLYTALNSIGIIEIKTKGANNTVKAPEMKVNAVKQFSQDNFDHDSWRYQTTLFWQPNLRADENGKIHLKLKVSEIKTEYNVVVDIVSENGISHQQKTSFSTIKE